MIPLPTNKNFSGASVLPFYDHATAYAAPYGTSGWFTLNGDLHPADQDIVSDSLIDARHIRAKKGRYWTRFPSLDDRNMADDYYHDSCFLPIFFFRFRSVSTMRFVVIIIIV